MITEKELQRIYEDVHPHVSVHCDEYHAHGPHCWIADTPEYLTIAKLHSEVVRLRGLVQSTVESLQEEIGK